LTMKRSSRAGCSGTDDLLTSMPATPRRLAPRYRLHARGYQVDLSRPTDEKTTEAPVTGASPVVVFVCETCRSATQDPAAPREGAVLAQNLSEHSEPGIEVKSVACLANCKRGLSATIQSSTGWSYIFGDLTTESGDDLLTGARLLSRSVDGLMPWKGRPDSLKRGMIARIPPFPSIQSQNQKP
jgi:predicted metal-binding protein